MPGTQPRGTHAFNPANTPITSSSTSLLGLDSEENEEEDEAGLPAHASPSTATSALSSAVSSLFSTQTPFSQPGVPSPPLTDSGMQVDSACATPPVSPPVLPISPPTTRQPRSDGAGSSKKRKHHTSRDADSAPALTTSKKTSRSAGGPTSSSKQPAMSGAVVVHALNNTLVHMIDVIQKLDQAPPLVVSPPEPQVPVPAVDYSSRPLSMLSDIEVVTEAFRIIQKDSALLEEEVLDGCLLFSEPTSSSIAIAPGYVLLADNPRFQCPYL